MSTFLDGVNRVLRNSTVISGDDDDLTSFTTTQHKASSILAQQAIQQTITDLVSDRLIPLEYVDDTIAMVDGTRVYNFPSDFVRLEGKDAIFVKLDDSGNAEGRVIIRYPGGEDRLKKHVLTYREQSGTPVYYYFPSSAVKQIAFYPVPNTNDDGDDYRYSYEKEVYPETEADSLPFQTTQETYAFLDMASRRFDFMFSKQPITGLQEDSIYKSAKAALTNLMLPYYKSERYGYNYR
jgi:hypothetical protein